MIKEHTDLEQLDCKISMNSTIVEDDKKESTSKRETNYDAIRVMWDISGIAEDWPKGSKHPNIVINPTKGIEIEPKVEGPDSWNQLILIYKFKACTSEIYILV